MTFLLVVTIYSVAVGEVSVCEVFTARVWLFVSVRGRLAHLSSLATSSHYACPVLTTIFIPRAPSCSRLFFCHTPTHPQPSFGIMGPLVIGASLYAAAITGGGFTGAALNPARVLGRSQRLTQKNERVLPQAWHAELTGPHINLAHKTLSQNPISILAHSRLAQCSVMTT